MEIRKATMQDLDRMLEIYEYARGFMKSTGNPTQWGGGYPSRELLEEDIRAGVSFVMEERGRIHGTFMFYDGRDASYDVIEDGNWLNDEPYGVIHRIAGDGQIRGLLSMAVEYASRFSGNLRMDTHYDNKVMQHTLEKNGFDRCGIIHLENGAPRIAYHRVRRA